MITYYALATAYGSLGNSAEAIRHFGMAIDLRPDYAPARYNPGRCYLMEGLTEEAEREFREALRIDPSFDNARQALDRISSNSPSVH